MRRVVLVGFCAAFIAAGVSPAHAQQRSSGPAFGVRGFVDVDSQAFAASDTFDAILGTARGTFVGGGGQFMWRGLVFEASASRFEDTGERAFVTGGRVFRLGIPTTIRITPIELTGSYRFPRLWHLVPYAGGGVGRQRYKETSKFADPAENVTASKTSYHIVGGTEVRVWRWIAAAAELRYRTVPDAIGKGGVSREFSEKDLGGTSIRVKILAGRW